MPAKNRKMFANEQMPANDHNRHIWSTYIKKEQFMAALNFIKDVEDYQDDNFYIDLQYICK